MGEYAYFRGQRIKIGTCEDLLYLRADQAASVSRADTPLDWHGYRFRFGTEASINLAQDAPGTYGQVTAGLNYSTGRLEAFARGELDFGGERDGISGRAGIRLRF